MAKTHATFFPFQLKEGMLVDLAGDIYADPKGNDPRFECEYATVMEIEVESRECVCVYFDGFAFGFPSEHMLRLPVEQFQEGGLFFLPEYNEHAAIEE
jgi:hypothetical protein